MSRARVAIIVVLLLGLLLLLLRSQAGVVVEPGSTLVVELSGEYIDGPERSLLASLFGERGTPLASLLSELAKAERDPRITQVVMRVGDLQAGWGKAQEMRAAFARLRERGRKVVAYLEIEQYGANLEYYVASAADEIHLTPATRSPFAGLAAEYLFFGGLFEKIGVDVEYERIGRYKSAVEAYAESSMSPANREMANSLLDSIESQFVTAIAQGRGLTPTRVREIMDAAPTTASELVDAGLADGVTYYDELLEAMGDPPVVEASEWAQVDAESLGFEPEATLALVYGSGPVVTGEGATDRRGQSVLASRTVADALLDAAEDPEIDGIIFRVDSPGGSALASDLVWHAVERAKESEKPLIVSFSDVAASGGYYVASNADSIIAQPATLTGSIGVFVLRPVLGGLFDKLGVGVESFTRGKHADLYLSSRPLSPGSRERLRADVEAIYELFVARVAEGRALPTEQVDAVGQGRVWTGEQALERGLVDSLGGLRVAALEARKALELDAEADVALVPYPPPRPLAEQIQQLLGGSVAAQLLPALPASLRSLAGLLQATPAGTPALVPPLLVEVR
ncbi:MAG: signal peptide peptidase SppA [Myxococcota bacterium]